jgi:hypothetical protein
MTVVRTLITFRVPDLVEFTDCEISVLNRCATTSQIDLCMRWLYRKQQTEAKLHVALYFLKFGIIVLSFKKI